MNKIVLEALQGIARDAKSEAEINDIIERAYKQGVYDGQQKRQRDVERGLNLLTQIQIEQS